MEALVFGVFDSCFLNSLNVIREIIIIQIILKNCEADSSPTISFLTSLCSLYIDDPMPLILSAG